MNKPVLDVWTTPCRRLERLFNICAVVLFELNSVRPSRCAQVLLPRCLKTLRWIQEPQAGARRKGFGSLVRCETNERNIDRLIPLRAVRLCCGGRLCCNLFQHHGKT